MIATIAELESHLAFTSDMAGVDSLLLQQKLEAAQGHVERLLGFAIEENFGGVDQDPVPTPLREAVLQLAAHWYENREGVSDTLRELPFGVSDLVSEFREFTF